MEITGLPSAIVKSKFFTVEQLMRLASAIPLPQVDAAFENERLTQIFQYYALNNAELTAEVYTYAAQLIDEGNIAAAWQVLLSLDVY